MLKTLSSAIFYTCRLANQLASEKQKGLGVHTGAQPLLFTS